MSNIMYYLIRFFITTTTYLYLITLLTDVSEYRFKGNFLSYLCLLIFIALNYYFDITNIFIFKNIFIIFGFILFIKLTSDISIKKSVIAFIRIFIMIMLCEMISGFIICYLLKMANPNLKEIVFIKILALIVLIIITYLVKALKKIIRIFIAKFDISWLFVTSIILLLITIGTLNYISTYNRLYNIYTLFIILLVFIILGVISIVRLLKKDYNKKVEINNLKSKNAEVTKYIDEFKTYKHNLKYDLLAIKNKGNDEVNKQIDILLNNNNNELKYINSFKEIPSNLIHVFSNCLTINNDNNINIVIKNSYKDKELEIDPDSYLILNEIIGNCLTNAIEAVPKENGLIFIYFYEDDINKYIKIINNFSSNMDVDKLGRINYSTKNRSSGFGLCSIFNNKYNIKVTGLIMNNLFEMKIIIS